MPTFLANRLHTFFPNSFGKVPTGGDATNCVNGVCELPGGTTSCCSSKSSSSSSSSKTTKVEEKKSDDVLLNGRKGSQTLNHRHPKPTTYIQGSRKTPERNFIGIESIDEWDSLCIESEKNQTPIIVDFTASWCKPCQRIGPFFKSLAKDYDAIFVKVDVDELDELAVRANVTVMPTFAVYFGVTQVDKSSGADEGKLDKMVGKFASKFCE